MTLTYKELAEKINQMTEEQKSHNVTICIADESAFFQVNGLDYTDKEDIDYDWLDFLDENQPVLVIR